MGDWYEICAVTNLPIVPGQEAVVIVPREGVGFFLDREMSHERARDDIELLIRGFREANHDWSKTHVRERNQLREERHADGLQ